MGIQNGYGALRRVYIRPPRIEDADAWQEYAWRSRPDPDAATAQHQAFRLALSQAGAELVVGTTPVPGDIDAQFRTTNGPAERRERAWIERARTSLPEPAGPEIKTRLLVGATRSIDWRN